MGRGLWPAVLLSFAIGSAAPAQQAPPPSFLFVSQERLLTASRRGQALLAAETVARDALRATAREIETAFEAEERQLTERRAELDTAAFRALADDFDVRVVAARSEQDARANALAVEFDQRRRQFYADVAPILVRVMEGVGALAIFDENSVLLTDQGLNITDEVIAEIDRDPSGTVPEPEPPPSDAPPDAGTE